MSINPQTNSLSAAAPAVESMAHQALDSVQSGVDDLRKSAPAALSRAAAQVEEITRRSLDRARETGAQVKDQVARAGDRSVDYIRDEPVKSVLIAAAAGAAVALLIGWMARPHSHRD